MTHWFQRGLILALLLCATPGQNQAQEHGVLLGLRYPDAIPKVLPYYAGSADSLSRPAYLTLLITEEQGTFNVLPEINDLLIPRGSRFWHAGAKRSVYNNWVEDFIWAAPEGTVQHYAGIQPFNGEYCQGHRTQTILYASHRYLSLNQHSAGYCEGGAHPWFFNTLAVVPVDSTSHTGLSIAEVFGEAGRRAFDAAVEAFLEGIRDENRRALYIEEPDPANWGLVRREGRWIAIGRVESVEDVDGSRFTDLPLALEVPSLLTGNARQADTWNGVKAFAPDVVDVFVAPTQNWLILLRPGQLTIHPVTGNRIGPSAMTKQLAPGTQVVMARWSTGSQLRAWIQHFARLAQMQGP